ncbi:hypothetical protein RHGRI_000357 [Rhododendron griersonianum]|uniref:GH18 domain-containing protein n=1 Tax=Rhododendron griersonianum TaxID=479676 RepID=A0AAV6LHD6_9ERIC|nr:hypothetical protein RHGRI_000357 [Rhododendron griersonianum]
MPFYGYAWRLTDANNRGLMAPADGPVGSGNGAMRYREILGFIAEKQGRNGVQWHNCFKLLLCWDNLDRPQMSSYHSSMAMALTIPTLFLLFLSSKFPCSSAQTWIKSGYWFSGSKFPVTDINSTLFTHLICGMAGLNPSTYQLSISSSDAQSFSIFTPTVRQKNPTVTTLLAIGVRLEKSSTFSSMVSQSEFRKSFIESSIKTARSYWFDGLDFHWDSVNTSSEMANMATLFDEWRLAIESESGNSSGSQLILTTAVRFSPYLDNASFPIESMKKNLDWVHVMAFDYYTPTSWNYTAAFAALHDPGGGQLMMNTEDGINDWIDGGLSANKLVLGLPFYGYTWTLVNPNDSAVGAPAKGTADNGWMSYKNLKALQISGAVSEYYNAAYVVNYCVIGSSWIAYDDVEVVEKKVAYAKKRNLLGYFVWQVEDDDENWVLTRAAQEDEKNPGNKRHFLLILLPTATTVTLVLVYATWYLRKRARKNKVVTGRMGEGKELQSLFKTTMASAGNANAPNLQLFRLTDLVEATNNFSFENKLGEGGYGPVYKGVLHNGQEIAVKRLSRTSTQGFEEFKNEVMLTAKLQHVNLAYDLWKCGKGMEFMDPSLDDTNSSCKLVKCMQIALLCVQENPVDRPSMLKLSVMLKNETAAMNIPKRPAFSTRSDEDEVQVQESTFQQEIWSVGDVSITQLVAR